MGYVAGLAQVRMMEVSTNIKNVPADILKALQKLIGSKGTFRVIGLLIVLAIFCVAFGAEFLFKRFYADFQGKAKSIPPMGGFLKFWRANMMIPNNSGRNFNTELHNFKDPTIGGIDFVFFWKST